MFVYLSIFIALSAMACKGTKTESDAADSGQVHAGNEGPADSAKLSVTPTETGGKDTSGQGSGNTNPFKDTMKTKPK